MFTRNIRGMCVEEESLFGVKDHLLEIKKKVYFKMVVRRFVEGTNCFCLLQIGDLKDHYHFFHSRTIKRSTLSSRGRHSFISMEPKVRLLTFLSGCEVRGHRSGLGGSSA